MSTRPVYAYCLFFLTMLGCVIGAPAQAAPCVAAIEGIGATPVVQYDPFRGAAESDDFVVRVKKQGDCDLGLAVFSTTPSVDRYVTSGPDRLLYRLFAPNGIEMPNDSSGALRLPAFSGTRGLFRLSVRVPANQIGPASRYEDRVTVRLFDVSGAPIQLGVDVDASVTAVIDPRAQVNIAGASGPFREDRFAFDRMNFGELSTGATRMAYVQIRATSPVSIRVSSLFKGMLRRSPLPERFPGLAYELAIDGATLNLSGGQASITRSPPVTLDGISYPLSVKITGRTDIMAEGEYQDLVTVDVIPT